MKVAVLSDVHGNLPALEAVLRDARRRRPNEIWNLGDLVGYGPYPEETVQRLRDEDVVNIAGNYDQRVVRWRPDTRTATPEAVEKWLASGWAHENLSADSLAFLASLPVERRWTREGRRILLTHASPASNTERLEPTTSPKRLHELAELAKADAVLFGHSHIPWIRQIGRTWFVNPGGVGRSDDGDARASYAMVNLSKPEFQVTYHRVPYHVKSVAEAIRQRGLPEAFARMLLESKPLDEIVKARPAKNREAVTLDNVLEFARRCRYEIGHAHQVTRLSMDLFDALRPLHHLGARPRHWLRYAAILHDVGWIEGGKGHHKTSLRLIESSSGFGLPVRERTIVACVARYHRGPHPRNRHRTYATLPPRDRRVVTNLAAILRVADGLDRTHRNVVEAVAADVSSSQVRITCRVRGPAEEERRFAVQKGRLLGEVFDRELVVRCRER